MHPDGRKTLRRTPTEADKKTERSPEKQKKSKKAKKMFRALPEFC